MKVYKLVGIKVLLPWIFILHVIGSTKILLNPSSINSHVIYFSTLGRKLAEEGYDVKVLVGSNVKTPNYPENEFDKGSFEFLKYPAKKAEPYASQPAMSQLFVEVALAKSSWSRYWKSFQLEEESKVGFEGECVDVIGNTELIKSLRKYKFEFLIMDFIAPECTYVLPLLLKVPFGIFSIPLIPWLFRVPRLASFTPFFADYTTDSMTFYERLCTLVREFGIYYIYSSTEENMFIKKYLLEASLDDDEKFDYKSSKVLSCDNEDIVNLDGMGLLQQARFWFLLEDLSVGYPNAMMPNTLSIGDVMIRDDTKPLPNGSLSNFVNKFNEKDGCVLVSFGSFFNHLPDSIVDKYCQLFRHFKNRLGFIWKLNRPLETVCPKSDNIFIQDWLPQNDLLSHECVKLFITHAGLNSLIESVNHKKPMIVVPVGIDQIGNAAMAVKKGYAVMMPLDGTFSVDEYIENIEKVIAPNSTYKQKVEFYSAILKDKSTSVGRRVGGMIDHFLKFGDVHLRSGAFDLNCLQFFMFDILTVLLFVAIFVLIFGFYIFKLCLKLFSRIFKIVYCKLKSKKEKVI